MRRNVVSLLIAGLLVSMLSGCGMEKREYDVTIELGEEYVFDAEKIFGCSKEEAKEYDANLYTLDPTRVGKYDVSVIKGSKEYIIHYTVEDTKAPVVKLNQKYIFTKNASTTDFSKLAKVEELSEYKETLCKFKKLDDAKVVDENTLKSYTDAIKDIKTEELLKRTDDFMTEDGIYSGVYVVEDVYGHKTAKEVIVIYDTQAPVVSGLEDLDTTIEVNDVNAEYTDDLLDKLSIADTFDGVISKDMLTSSMELTDNANHIYKVKAEYTDRAGNKAAVEYDITLKEKKATLSNNGGNNAGSSNNGGSSSGGGNNSGSNNNDTANTGNSNSSNVKPGYENMSGYIVKTEDVKDTTVQNKREVAANGMYNLTVCSNGAIWVLVEKSDFDTGVAMIDEYLTENGYTWSDMDGGWFDINNTAYYCCIFPGDYYPIE